MFKRKFWRKSQKHFRQHNVIIKTLMQKKLFKLVRFHHTYTYILVASLPGLFSLLLLESKEWSWGRRGFGRSTSPLLGSVVQLRRNLSVGPLLNTSNGPHSYTEESNSYSIHYQNAKN
jgi:hypothetical protein